MTLMEQIKNAQIDARKNRHSSAIVLTTLIGEAAMIGKNDGDRETTDQEVISVIKKFIKNIDETIAALSMTQYVTAIALTDEKMVLEKFLPHQLNEDTLRAIAKQYKDLPDLMRHLKQEYAGKYDGKMASAIAKEVYK